LKDKQCLYPHFGITLEAFGEVRLCTSAMDVEFDLKNEAIDLRDILNSSQYEEVREVFNRGELPSSCRSCKKVEGKGVLSKREIFTKKRTEKYGKEKVEAILSQKVKKPLHLSIGFSNNCNLQCSMCSSKYSQLWKSNEEAFNRENKNAIESYGQYVMNSQNIDELVEVSEECTDIFIKGGEPFYSPEALSFLKKLSERSHRPHVFIQTNGTILTKEIMDIIVKLNIEVGISIDGVGSTYEWIRGFSYQSIVSNIEKISKLSANTDHKISLDHTTSIFNVTSLPSTFDTFLDLMQKNQGIGHLSVFSIARQDRNNFLALPLLLRETIHNELASKNKSFVEAYDVLSKSLVLKQLTDKQQEITRDWIHFLERSRGKIPARANESFSSWLKESSL
jgi:MoaA/NifB/PqqE/SkfB family radical SAM enzyme